MARARPVLPQPDAEPAQPQALQEWKTWLDGLPGGDLSEEEAMAQARQVVDEVRTELHEERKRRS